MSMFGESSQVFISQSRDAKSGALPVLHCLNTHCLTTYYQSRMSMQIFDTGRSGFKPSLLGDVFFLTSLQNVK